MIEVRILRDETGAAVTVADVGTGTAATVVVQADESLGAAEARARAALATFLAGAA